MPYEIAQKNGFIIVAKYLISRAKKVYKIDEKFDEIVLFNCDNKIDTRVLSFTSKSHREEEKGKEKEIEEEKEWKNGSEENEKKKENEEEKDSVLELHQINNLSSCDIFDVKNYSSSPKEIDIPIPIPIPTIHSTNQKSKTSQIRSYLSLNSGNLSSKLEDNLDEIPSQCAEKKSA